MPISRGEGRNVWIYLEDDDKEIGGMVLNPGHITNDEFYEMVSILVVAVVPDNLISILGNPLFVIYHLQGADWVYVQSSEAFMLPGKYKVKAVHQEVSLAVNDEPFIDRVVSLSVTGRNEGFKNKLRDRDGGCVITGKRNRDAYCGNWGGFQACHIFPLDQGSQFVQSGLHNCISDMPNVDAGPRMNSPQNGMMLRSDIHDQFGSYVISRGYKIYNFRHEDEVMGKTLWPTARESGERGVRNALLLWHFRMCVFANMRKAGEQLWDYNIREDRDIVGAMLLEDHTGRRHAMELSNRLTQLSAA